MQDPQNRLDGMQISLMRTGQPPPRVPQSRPVSGQLHTASNPYLPTTSLGHHSLRLANSSSLYRASSGLSSTAVRWPDRAQSVASKPVAGTACTSSDAGSVPTYSEASEPMHSRHTAPPAQPSLPSSRVREGGSSSLSHQSSSQWCVSRDCT
jgi:hypothetical protein